jgi:hypothetical protein
MENSHQNVLGRNRFKSAKKISVETSKRPVGRNFEGLTAANPEAGVSELAINRQLRG